MKSGRVRVLSSPRRDRLRAVLHRDLVASSMMALFYSLALGISSLALPLIALSGGHGAAGVGLLYSFSAITQIITRLCLGVVMRRISDRALLVVAVLALLATFLVVLASPSMLALAIAWIVQGFSRSCFWTGGQTHVVRGQASAVGALGALNFFGSLGQLVGPVVAGVFAETNIDVALVLGAFLVAFGIVPTLALNRLAPFVRLGKQAEGALWRRRGIDAACGAGFTTGAWRGLMDSFVPVVLQGAKQSSTTIGALVSVANCTAVFGAVVVSKLRPGATAWGYGAAVLAAGIGMGALGYAAGHIPWAAIALGIAGLGAGALQTLGPALAATSVHAQEQGQAIALYGTARTVMMFVAPLSLAGVVLVLPVPPVLIATGLLMAAPIATVRSLRTGPRNEGKNP